MEWVIGPRIGRYRVIPASDDERETLKGIGALEFDALSVGRAPNGPQVAIIPLDESSREIAEAIATFPALVVALKGCRDALDRIPEGRRGLADSRINRALRRADAALAAIPENAR